MNGKQVKRLKEIIGYVEGDEISKKVFKKTKKKFNSLNDKEKADLIQSLKTIQQSK